MAGVLRSAVVCPVVGGGCWNPGLAADFQLRVCAGHLCEQAGESSVCSDPFLQRRIRLGSGEEPLH